MTTFSGHSPLPVPDFRVLFEAAPGMMVVLTPDFRVAAVNDGYLQVTRRSREELLGRVIFELFPDNPDDPAANGVESVTASLQRVLRDKVPDAMPVQRYDVAFPDSETGEFDQRYWSLLNSPVLNADGDVAFILHRVEDVTEFVRISHQDREREKQSDELRLRFGQAETAVLLRAQELQEANEKLREANEERARMQETLEHRVHERTQELAERIRLLALSADVGRALAEGHALQETLHRCAAAMVHHLGGAFARIWTFDPLDDVLRLQASAGIYTHLDGAHSQVPIGKYKIGMIAQERKPHLTNAVVGDPRVSDQEWARQEGMIAFAGYPLIVDDSLVGVMAMFARHALPEATLKAMAAVADEIAVGIQRKSAQESLFEQREWLRVTLASIGDAVIATDTQGRVVFMNPVAEELTGWPSADAHGEPLETVFAIINEQSRLTVENPVEKVLRDGIVVGLANHTILIARDGTERPIDDSAAPIRDAGGEMRGVVLVFRDVTEHRQAETELRRSEEELADFFENATVGLHWVGADGEILRANAAELSMLGYSREEFVGRNITEFHADDDVIADMLARLKAGEQLRDYEARLQCRDGSIRHVLIDSSAMFRNGQFVHTRCFTRDVTEERRVQQERQLLVSIVENSPDFIGISDIDGVPVYANQAAIQMLGIQDFEQVLSSSIPDYFIPEQREFINEVVLPAVARDGRWSGELSLQHFQTGAAIPVLYDIFRVDHPDTGKPLNFATVTRDITERKRAESQLKESSEKLRLLADTIPQLAWTAHPDGEIFWYNQRWYEFTGTTPKDMEGWGWQSVHDPEVLPGVIERWQHSLNSGEPFDMVFPLRGADGLFRTFLTRVSPLVNDEGRILYWFGTNTDITELRETREALAASEERLRLALEAGRMGVWDWNIRTGELSWSDSLEPLHGLEPGTFGGTFEAFQQLIHPDDRSRVDSAIQGAMERRGEFEIEFRNLRPTGGIHWISGSGRVFCDEGGVPLRMIGIGTDVTLRKRIEQTARFLADASAALAVLVDFDSTLQKVASLAVPYFADWAAVDVLEPDGTLRRVAVAHIEPAKVQLAHDLHRRYPADPNAPQGVWTILRSGRPELFQEITDEMLKQSAKDEEYLNILRNLGLKSYIGVPLTVRGKTLGVITFIAAESGHQYDETDLAVAEDLASRAAIAIENAQLYRELREADRRKDEFLATLAHELRNPLAPIRNGLQVLRLSDSHDTAIMEVRAMMERQLSQMVRLVDDLLDVSRITRNKLELRKQRVHLKTVIQSAIETSRPLFENSGHKFSLSLPEESILLDADLTRLAQVFSNLLNNSAKYTEPGGHISLQARLNGGEVEVRVTDDGLGIPPDALPRLFQMFSQVDRNLERAQGGLGIGLTLVRRLVEMHGGTVEGASDGPGLGSLFTVRLPVVQEDGLSGPDISEIIDAGLTVKRRILVVDDNHDSALSLSMMLSLMGNETRMAHDGLAAVDEAAAFRPDVILLDIGLPRLNGYDACRRIREQPWARNTVIAALTGWGQDEDRRRSADAGFDHHLVKPVEPSALDEVLATPAASPAPSVPAGPGTNTAPRPKSASVTDALRLPADPLRVLIVDDMRDATFMLSKLMQAAGHDVRTAADGPSALATAIEYRPDVVLLDISLPGMSGLEVAREIRRHPAISEIVLVAMTGYGDESDRQRSFEAGFNHHLVKPADIRELKQILATVR